MSRSVAVLAWVLMSAAGIVPTYASQQHSNDESVQGPSPPEPPEVVSRDDQGRATIRTMRLPSPLLLDGQLTEQFYESVPAITDFVQQEPNEGKPATEKTEVWVFFDEKNIYVSARCWESDPSKRVTSDMRRDSPNLYNNDHFAVLFDTFYDRRNAYAFYANAQGGLQDAIATNEQPNNNWNAIWEVQAASFDRGWTIEFRIPFRSMRFREGGHVWGVNFRRMVRWKNEISFLTPIPASYGRRGLMMASFAGSLVGLETPTRMRNLDVKPYVLGSTITDRNAIPVRRNDADGDVGVDVKWGITQQLVADFTYNTDFAQVEDDEQQVNLTRFSLFFPEKREFFLEGQDIFSFGGSGGGGGGGGAGGGGQGGGGGGGSTPPPNSSPVLFFSRRIGLQDGVAVPILGGGRLLGRAGRYNFGAISMRTSEARGVAPVTDFGVFRVSRDVLRRSRVGLLATRRSPESGATNYAYGADGQFNFFDNVSINGFWAGTRTSGLAAPDQSSYKTSYNWNADRYGVQAEHLYVGEHFDPQVGFLRREAFRRSYAQGRFSPRPADMRGVRKLAYEASLDYITDPAGRLQSRETQGTFRIEMESGDSTSLEYTRSFEQLDETFEVAKDVYVPVGGYTFQQLKATYFLGPQRPVSGTITVAGGSFYDGRLTEVSYRGRLEPSSRFYLEPTVSWNRISLPWGTADTNLASVRLTYTLSPRMFVSALLQYQSRFDSLTSNARFRWEYLPGSELFVVYSDGRDTLQRGFPALVNRSFVVKATRLFRW